MLMIFICSDWTANFKRLYNMMKKIVNNMNSIFNKVLNLKRFKDKKKKFALRTLLSFRIGTQE